MEVAPVLTQKQLRAAEEIVQTISEVLSKSGVLHPETAVMSAARIAGTFLFREYKFPTENIAPGTAVLSDNANNAAPLLFNTLAATLQVLGVSTDPKKRSHFPGLSHPTHAPKLSVTDAQKLLEAPLRATAARFDLNSREAAQSCSYCCRQANSDKCVFTRPQYWLFDGVVWIHRGAKDNASAVSY